MELGGRGVNRSEGGEERWRVVCMMKKGKGSARVSERGFFSEQAELGVVGR